MAERVRGKRNRPAITSQALSRRRFLACGSGLAFPWVLASPGQAAPPLAGGSSDRASQEKARRAIPQHKLTPLARRKVQAVLRRVTVFRRTPVKPVYCAVELFEFLTLHPDVLVGLWHVLGISNVRLRRTGPRTFVADDGAGTQSDVEFLYSAPGYHLVYSVGRYQGPLAPRPIRGGCLLQLHYAPVPQATVPTLLTRMEIFVRVDNLAVDLITRAFRNTVGKMADLNYTETVAFVGQMYRVAQRRPELLHQMTARMTGVARDDRERFVRLVYQVAGLEAPEEPLLAESPPAKLRKPPRVAQRPRTGPAPNAQDGAPQEEPLRQRWYQSGGKSQSMRR